MSIIKMLYLFPTDKKLNSMNAYFRCLAGYPFLTMIGCVGVNEKGVDAVLNSYDTHQAAAGMIF
jgi:hypothetical protein